MDDVYIRYLSYEKQADLEADMCAKNPFKIDIGPVMTARPKDNRMFSTNSMQPVQRELIFDIDMTDYDEVRTCCSGADICQKCWKFMVIACQIIDAALRGEYLSVESELYSKVNLNVTPFHFYRGLQLRAHFVGIFRSSWYPLLGLR